MSNSKGKVTIAIDGMGGDKGTTMVVRGLDIALERTPNLHFLIFGDEEQINKEVNRYSRLRGKVEIIHTEEQVENNMTVVRVMRRQLKSSLSLAIKAVREGRAQCALSAGHTGALMGLSVHHLGCLEGIDRPALAAIIPTLKKECCLLDLGANINCGAHNLVQFSLLGRAFIRSVLNIKHPRVAILNIGKEYNKGDETLRETYDKLHESHFKQHFHGFVEGDDIFNGDVDVIVFDGFVGNICLKVIEGTGRYVFKILRGTLRYGLLSRFGGLLLRHNMRKFRHRIDPRNYSGAVLLGLKGVVIKSHGSSDSFSFANSLKVAVNMVHRNFIGEALQEINNLSKTKAMEATK